MGFAGGKENFFAKKLFFPSCTSQSFKKLLNNAFIFLLPQKNQCVTFELLYFFRNTLLNFTQ